MSAPFSGRGDTPPQAALGRDERRKNIRAAFVAKKGAAGTARDVVLVDDVATTGSTLNACSLPLVRVGVERVFCLVVARAVDRKSGT